MAVPVFLWGRPCFQKTANRLAGGLVGNRGRLDRSELLLKPLGWY